MTEKAAFSTIKEEAAAHPLGARSSNAAATQDKASPTVRAGHRGLVEEVEARNMVVSSVWLGRRQ